MKLITLMERQMSEDSENLGKVPLTLYVSEAERDYLNEQARKNGLRRPNLLYVLLAIQTNNFQRSLQLMLAPATVEEVTQ